eukprot:9070785-Ditylum_brightwellii.AAC.1
MPSRPSTMSSSPVSIPRSIPRSIERGAGQEASVPVLAAHDVMNCLTGQWDHDQQHGQGRLLNATSGQ